MKILFLNTEQGWRGGERQTLLTMKALHSQGLTIELLARPASPLAYAASNAGFVVHSGSGFFSCLKWLCLNSASFEALHAHTAFAATVLAVFKIFKKTPILFTRRTDFIRQKTSWLRTLKWQQFDRMIAISHSAAQEPLRLGLQPTVIRSAVPPVKPKPLRVQRFLQQNKLIGKPLIGTAAVFTADKDPLTCIRVAAEISKKYPDVVFLHWGGGGELEEYCKNYVRTHGLEQRYIFLGFMDRPEELYPCLTAFISTSRIEALGTSVLDAMIQRIPVVATCVGGLRETLCMERGFLAPAESPALIAESLERVLKNQDEVTLITKRAYAFVAEVHDIKNLATRYIQIYSSVISKCPTKISPDLE
jgi:glycosyltransferase involved in cell wall biosynthesis